MSMQGSKMFLSGEFVEVAMVITMAKDLKGTLTARELSSANALIDHYSQEKTLYTRRQYFEYDGCDIDDDVRDMAASHSQRLQEISRLYEKLEINPTAALVEEFKKVTANDDFQDLLTATVPNDLRLEFEDDRKRTMQVRVLTQVPFLKTREIILGQIDEAAETDDVSIASVAICAHMRFLPPATKQVGLGFHASIKGLH